MMEWLSDPLLQGSPLWLATRMSAGFASLLVLLWAWGQWLLFRRLHLRPLQQQVADIRQSLAQTPDEPLAFASHYPAINRRMQAHTLLNKVWESYCAGLIFSQGEGPIMSSRPAQQVVQTTALLDGRVDRRFYQAMPGYLTAVGLLFTFAGLMVTLFSAGQEMTMVEGREARQAIHLLLMLASLQFLPTVAALLAAGWFSLRLKGNLHRLDQEVLAWCRLLDQRIATVTYEQLIYSQLLESRLQTRRLVQLTSQLERPVTVLDEALGGVRVTSQPPLETVLRMVPAGNGEVPRQLEQFLERFLRQWQEQSTAQTEPMRDQVERFSLAMRQVGGVLQTFHQQLDALRQACQQSTRELHNLSAPFAEVADLLRTTLVQIRDSHHTMAQLAEDFPAAATAILQAHQQTREILQSYQERLQGLEGMVTLLSEIRTDVAAFPDLVAEHMARKSMLAGSHGVSEDPS